MDSTGILDLSDECLLHIFQYVDSTDLFHLSSVCQKFSTIVLDEYLWTWADGRSRPNVEEKYDFIKANIHKRTRALMLAGMSRSHRTFLSNDMPKMSSFKALTVLALENQLVHGLLSPLIVFPPTLEELSLRHTYVTSYDEFFRFCSLKLTSLRVLCLDRCTWFDSQVLLPISKLPQLEILSFYLCKQLTDNEISYICLAGGYGFKKLKCLDVRFTDYGDEMLNGFCRVSTLGELYFQNYCSTYEIEVARRKIAILERDHFADGLKDSEGVNDLDSDEMHRKFGDAFNYRTYDQYKLSDTGVRNYRFIGKDPNNPYVPPKSVLYKRPYGKCRCKSRSKKMSKVPISHEIKHLQSEIERLQSRSENPRRHYLEVIGEPFGSTAPPPELRWLFDREPRTDEEISIMDHRPNRIHLIERSLIGSSVIEVNVFANGVPMEPVPVVENDVEQVHPFRPLCRRFYSHIFGVRKGTEKSAKAEGNPGTNEPRPSSSKAPAEASSPDPQPSCSKPPDDPRPSSSEDESQKSNSKRRHAENSAPTAQKKMRLVEERPEVEPIPESPVLRIIRDPAAPDEFRLINLNVMRRRNVNNLVNLCGLIARNTTSITHLSLRGYKLITDLSLDYLEEMNLELLDVTGTMVTKEGVESFLRTNPDCRVLHESACRCMPNLHF